MTQKQYNKRHFLISLSSVLVLVLREDEVQPVPGGGNVGVHAGGGRGAAAEGVGLEAGQPAAAHQGAARVARAHHAGGDIRY